MMKPVRMPRVLVVAGSDSGGGAGIQADIKTVMALGGYAGTAITALTAQNTLGVADIMPVKNTFVAAQMVTFLEDIGADIIKIGMLHNADIIRLVKVVLLDHSPEIPVILDPVMVAKGGARLLQPDAEAAIKTLFPRVRLLTPNIPEAEAITGLKIRGPDEMLIAARKIIGMGSMAVLIKGGHLEDGMEIYDVLLDKEQGEYMFTSERLVSPNTHGTGCTLASAIATLYAQSGNLRAAVSGARTYLKDAILRAPNLGKGCGPLQHRVLPEEKRA